MEKATTDNKPIVLTLPEFGEDISYTGETIKTPRLEIPQIRVSYKDEGDEGRVCPKGELVEYDMANKTSKPLGKTITIQILHHRQSLSAYKDLGSGNSESYYTPEISMKSKVAPLFMAKQDSTGRRTQFLIEGDISKEGPLRKMVPDLRYQRSLYVWHDGALKNLIVYGASFSAFIDLTKALQGKSSSSVAIELSTRKEKTGAVTYYPLTFTPKDPIDIKAIEPELKKLAMWFEEYDNRVLKQRQDKAEQAAIEHGDVEVLEVKAEETKEEDADVNIIELAKKAKDKDDEDKPTKEELDELFGKGNENEQV